MEQQQLRARRQLGLAARQLRVHPCRWTALQAPVTELLLRVVSQGTQECCFQAEDSFWAYNGASGSGNVRETGFERPRV